MSEIPHGYCQCGCGQPAKIAQKTDRRHSMIKGEPMKYAQGHGGRLPVPDPIWDNDLFCYRIPLTRGKYALIDKSSVDRISKHRWAAHKIGNTWYAARKDRNANGKMVFMHREVMECPNGMVVDHVNRDGLDNRLSNLRVCSHSQNIQNKKIQKNNSSGWIGVNWSRVSQKWQAGVALNGKNTHVGLFLCPIEAAIARDVAAIEVYGEYASLNFPQLKEVF